ncbi:xyloglucan endotransglucosylase/hydrolase protein 2-like [Olea europaea var. sylvestris]|uniref:xyloglucan endotransglucosylase/hydrolase protein 2-like n=1 Tax=Olea europaea var. sylvestris TaxID=158386 RepID=UPI000C1D3B52|nr:xyloglucan endotransglucosylase/hydrolase protein 2-like [Olea europaea var. sylvestris]
MALFFLNVFAILLGVFFTNANGSFYQYYSPLWGLNHLTVNPQATDVQLLMDRSSGAGFRSKLDYGSGLFHIRMKIPDKKTGGIVTSFYLTSASDNRDPGNHYELDFEFLGTTGKVQTNVFDNDEGHREQTFNLWFDPSEDFHTYEILWNPHQIVFFVDKIPIRVFKNNTAHGVDYPWKPMHIEASVWEAEWAGVVDWSQAPFIAQYQDFDFRACPAQINMVSQCNSDKYFWNRQWELNAEQKQQMESYRNSYMVYDYCSKTTTSKPECSLNN